LLFKVYPLLNHEVLFITGLAGGVTILLTGLTAITATDVKQLLAASTSSQLGFMLLAVGAGSPGAAFAHWVAHAFMKASLFMGAGIFQHVYHSTSFEDIQGSGKKLKATFTGFAIAAIGLSGIPPLIGYWSKDEILAATSQYTSGKLFFLVAVVGAFFTAVYMGKAIKRLWAGQQENHPTPDLKYMLTGLFLLVAFIIGGGFFLEPVVKFAGYEIPTNTVSEIAGITAAIAGLAAGWYVKESSFSAKWWSAVRENYTIAGGYKKLIAEPVLKCATFFNKVDFLLLAFVQKIGNAFLFVSRLARNADTILNRLTDAVGNTGITTSHLSRSFEQKGIEAGVYGVSSAIQESGKWGRKLQTGLVHKELVITIAGLLILIFILIAMIAYG
jgi:NADH-quinone oxidoreductase subunit L